MQNYWLLALVCDINTHQATATERLRAAKKVGEHQKKAAFKRKAETKADLEAQVDSLLVFGEACMLSGFHQMTSTYDYTKAVMNLKAAWGAFQDVEKLLGAGDVDQELVHLAHFDLGMFLWFLSLLPEFLGPAAKLLALVGFKGDSERGIAYLEEVAASSSLRAPFATVILVVRSLYLPMRAFPYVRSEDPNVVKGKELLATMEQRWPTGFAGLLVRGIGLRKLGELDEAKAVFENLTQLLQGQGIDPAVARVQTGLCYAKLTQWGAAGECFAACQEDKAYIRPYTPMFLRGLCMIQQKNDAEGHQLINTAIKLAKKAKDSEFTAVAEKFTSNGFMGIFEVMWSRGEFSYKGNSEDALIASLDEMAGVLGINATDRGETATTKKYKHSAKEKAANALILNATKGILHRLKGQDDEALKFLTKATNLVPHGKPQKVAFWSAHFEAADIHFEAGNKEEAAQLLKKAATNANTSRLKNSARQALAKLSA